MLYVRASVRLYVMLPDGAVVIQEHRPCSDTVVIVWFLLMDKIILGILPHDFIRERLYPLLSLNLSLIMSLEWDRVKLDPIVQKLESTLIP